ncbi:hypothetical protein ACHAXR_012141 [Thalassiosira sp. AJA248-18]
MTTASSTNPSYQDTLMELYNGRHNKDSVDSVVVHGNGSPFSPPAQNNHSPSSSTQQSSGQAVGSLHSAGSSNTSQKGNKKKVGSKYHFIPMMGKKSHRHNNGGSNSDSDDEYYGDIGSNGFANNKHTTTAAKSSESNYSGRRDVSNLSDQDMLRDIFTTSNSGPVNNSTAQNNGNGHSIIKLGKDKNGNANFIEGGGSSSGDGLKMTQPLHSEAGKSNTIERQRDAGKEQFTSPLGRRIWRQYLNQQQQKQSYLSSDTSPIKNKGQALNTRHRIQYQYEDKHTPPAAISFRQLPSPDFLRLPSTLVQIRSSSSNKIEWVNTEELERKVMQHHLDLEALEPAESPLMKGEHNIHSLSSSLLTSECFTRVIERDSKVGLGMSLREYDGCVYIQALLRLNGSRLEEDGMNENDHLAGPAYRARLLNGDRLLGLNGQPFLKGRLATHGKYQVASSSDEVLKSVGDVISTAKSPMALHIQRESDRQPILTLLRELQIESNEKKNNNVPMSKNSKSPPRRALSAPIKPAKLNLHDKQPKTFSKGPIIHPFAKAMAERNLIQKGKEELVVTRQLRIFTDRTRQWESKLAFRLRASDFSLRPLLDARDVEPSYYASFFTDDGECPPFFDYKFSKSLRTYAPSTPMIQDWRLSHPDKGMAAPARRVSSQRLSREAAIMADLYDGLGKQDAYVQDILLGGKGSAASSGEVVDSSIIQAMADPSDVFVPLLGVRKAICVRILNSFLDNKNRTAFTIWCYDCESGMEWYAPVRYYNDFKDLRSALMRMDKTIGDIPFPSLGWSLGFASEAKESAKTKEARRNQLENFLRRVFGGVYRGRLHPHLSEVAVHLQTFVGCDTVLGEGDDSSLSLSKQVAISESSYGKRTPDPKSEPDNNARMLLKRSVMRYVYRLFLLPGLEQLVTQFVNAAMEKVMTEAMGPSGHQSHQFAADKDEATKDVEKIRDFIDQVQELIIEGCYDDFVSMSQRRDFAALVDDVDNSIRDNLFREAVREQTELEVYVPLRSTISKYLVYAWFNEDIEMKHKMKALAEKPQAYFRIPKEHRSRSNWKSVSGILREGVGRSTLPCVKLRAVVDAAKEISQLDSEERSVFPDASFFDGKVVTKVKTLGADDFLPIFIFCFVQAKIERPSALFIANSRHATCFFDLSTGELLSVMCDRAKMNGETGYYLASFHAALTHIHELDLTEAENDLSIIFDA